MLCTDLNACHVSSEIEFMYRFLSVHQFDMFLRTNNMARDRLVSFAKILIFLKVFSNKLVIGKMIIFSLFG